MNSNIDFTLYNSPYYENLVSELFRIIQYKSTIFKRIDNQNKLINNLTPEQKTILNDLTNSETRILLEILKLKNLTLTKGNK